MGNSTSIKGAALKGVVVKDIRNKVMLWSPFWLARLPLLVPFLANPPLRSLRIMLNLKKLWQFLHSDLALRQQLYRDHSLELVAVTRQLGALTLAERLQSGILGSYHDLAGYEQSLVPLATYVDIGCNPLYKVGSIGYYCLPQDYRCTGRPSRSLQAYLWSSTNDQLKWEQEHFETLTPEKKITDPLFSWSDLVTVKLD